MTLRWTAPPPPRTGQCPRHPGRALGIVAPAAAAELEACGAKVADQPTIGSTCDLVLTMLPNAPQVKQVMLGANGVAAHMQPGSTFIDMTSLNPIASKEIAAELAARGIQMLDAPVSGGEPKAIDGTLSFMVGGEEEVFNTFKPVLLAMGSSAVLCGGIGAGNTTKLANQIIVACGQHPGCGRSPDPGPESRC